MPIKVEYEFSGTGGSTAWSALTGTPTALLLDQSVPQTVLGGMPIFDGGISAAFDSIITDGTESITFEDISLDLSGLSLGTLKFPSITPNYNTTLEVSAMLTHGSFGVLNIDTETHDLAVINYDSVAKTFDTATITLVAGDMTFEDTNSGSVTLASLIAGASAVTSVFTRTGDVVAETDDYTWAQIDKTTSDIADIATRSHTDLTDIGTHSHDAIDAHIDTTYTEGSVLFAASDGTVTEDNSYLFYNSTVKQLRIGDVVVNENYNSTSAPLIAAGHDAQYVQIYVQNREASPYGMGLLVAAADDSGGTLVDTLSNVMGIASSVFAHPSFSFLQPHDGFLCAIGGDEIIGALYPTKKVIIATGGSGADNVRMWIKDDGATIFANLETESCPALEAVNWTATNGFSAGSAVITCVDDIDDSTIEPSAATWVEAGETYKIVITASAVTGTIGYTLGSVEGVPITATTITDYITASDTGKFIITATAGATCTITSISIRQLVANTGNLQVGGDISFGSKLSTLTGSGILTANSLGVATFDQIPLLPNNDPSSDNQAVRKAYVDTVLQGLYPVFNCRVATTTNGTLATAYEEGDVIDTETLVAGDIILIKNQTDETENGFYEVQASGAPARVVGYETGDTMLRGVYTSIEEGSTNLKTSWVMYAPDALIDTDDILFRQNYVGQPLYTGEDGISIAGYLVTIDLSDTNPSLEIEDGGLRVKVDAVSIDRSASGLVVSLSDTNPSLEITDGGLRAKVDDSSIERSASGLQVKALGVTSAMLAGSIADSKLSQITSAGKVAGNTAITGVIPIANLATGTPDGTKFIRDDGTLVTPSGGSGGSVDSVVAGDGITVDATDPANPIVASTFTNATPYAEVPSGLVNSSNVTYTLAHTPTYPANVIVVLDGVTQYYGVDYTVSTATITFVTAPVTGSTIFAYYSSTGSGIGAVFSGLSKITVGTTEPTSPSAGDLWVDTN